MTSLGQVSRRNAAAEIIDRWAQMQLGADSPRDTTLIDESGQLKMAIFDRLRSERNNREMRLIE